MYNNQIDNCNKHYNKDSYIDNDRKNCYNYNDSYKANYNYNYIDNYNKVSNNYFNYKHNVADNYIDKSVSSWSSNCIVVSACIVPTS